MSFGYYDIDVKSYTSVSQPPGLKTFSQGLGTLEKLKNLPIQ
jgi:hypothetical protein